MLRASSSIPVLISLTVFASRSFFVYSLFTFQTFEWQLSTSPAESALSRPRAGCKLADWLDSRAANPKRTGQTGRMAHPARSGRPDSTIRPGQAVWMGHPAGLTGPDGIFSVRMVGKNKANRAIFSVVCGGVHQIWRSGIRVRSIGPRRRPPSVL